MIKYGLMSAENLLVPIDGVTSPVVEQQEGEGGGEEGGGEEGDGEEEEGEGRVGEGDIETET